MVSASAQAMVFAPAASAHIGADLLELSCSFPDPLLPSHSLTAHYPSFDVDPSAGPLIATQCSTGSCAAVESHKLTRFSSNGETYSLSAQRLWDASTIAGLTLQFDATSAELCFTDINGQCSQLLHGTCTPSWKSHSSIAGPLDPRITDANPPSDPCQASALTTLNGALQSATHIYEFTVQSYSLTDSTTFSAKYRGSFGKKSCSLTVGDSCALSAWSCR